MNENKIEICATTIKEFEEISEKLSTLSNNVRSQIKSVSKTLIGIECIIPYTFKSDRTISLPVGVSHTAHFDNFIGVYHSEFFFKIMINDSKDKISFIFEQPENNRSKQ